MTRRRLLFAVLLALLVVFALAFSICRFLPIRCHGSSEQDPFKGLAGTGSGTTQLPRGFAQEVVASGLERPTSFALLPDGRVLVAEKRGLVWAVAGGRLQRPPLVDIRARVADYGYRGLLAIEPGASFAKSPALYVTYVQGRGPTRSPTSVRVSRIELDGRRGRERIVIGRGGRRSCNELPRGSDCLPCDEDHCGGDIEFAADGSLFVVAGEGWGGSPGSSRNALRAQDLDSLGGKLLHMTADGRGLPANPFWDGDPTSNRSKIWAYGFRHPFRMTLPLGGGDPVVGDVGWNDWEEIDTVPRGANMGWPCFEGPDRPEEYATKPVCRALYRRGRMAVRFPLIAYHRGSVTGGVFYRGTSFPAEYRGGYFYGDWSRSVLRFARIGPDERVQTDAADFATGAAGPVQLEIGPEGSLYYLALNVGELRRIAYRG
jgi:glucose/arabinose dehydrogenase